MKDETLSADERVRRLMLDEVRRTSHAGTVSPWADDGNDIVWTRPKFKPEFEHIRRCATLYLDNLQPAGISTGFCHTCGEWEIGMRFDAACTCGYRQDGLVWWMVHGRDEQNDLHDLYDALDQY